MNNNTGINSDWLEKLKAKCDIVSVLSKYIKLERKGKTYWSCCPFHHEKTPSFAVNEYEQYYHCFGCKESGDVIKFVQTFESVDFLDAVQILADSVKMELPSFSNDKEIFELKQKKTKSKEILRLTNERYKQNLANVPNNPAINYLKKRDISNESIKKFEIGFSKDWNDLPAFLKSKGFTYDEMKEAGVVEFGETGNNVYDFVGERLTFPIFNTSEEVVGFSARILKQSDFAKYKNTFQTVMFNKSKAIFGINHLKKEKQQGSLKQIIVVEGQIDVIAMHQSGFTTAVACMGTALTKEHARELSRFCNEVVLCFDGDTAGTMATMKSIETLSEFDFNVRVVALPAGVDPDDYIKQFGKEKMQELIDNAKSVIEYKLEVNAAKFDMEKPDEKAKFLKVAIDILNSLQTFSQKQVYLEKIRNLSGVPIDVLRRDMSQTSVATKTETKKIEKPEFDASDNAISKATKFVLASVIHKKPYAESKHLTEEFFKNPLFKSVFNYVIEQRKSGKEVIISDLYNVFDIDSSQSLKEVIYYNFDDIGNNAKQYFDDSLWVYFQDKLKERQQKLSEEYRNCTSEIERKQIALEISNIAKQLKSKRLED